MRAHPTTTYVSASPATWELIRGAYLAGLSAAAARFGVSVSALRKRAQREGWTKAAYAAVAGGLHGPLHHAPSWAAHGSPPPRAGEDLRSPTHYAPAWHGGAAYPRDARMEEAAPPLRISPAGLAATALRAAARAVSMGRGREARALVLAAKEIAELEDLIPYEDETDSDEAFEARQAILNDVTWERAVELADAMATGRPLTGVHAEAAAAWRRSRALRSEGGGS